MGIIHKTPCWPELLPDQESLRVRLKAKSSFLWAGIFRPYFFLSTLNYFLSSALPYALSLSNRTKPILEFFATLHPTLWPGLSIQPRSIVGKIWTLKFSGPTAKSSYLAIYKISARLSVSISQATRPETGP